MLTWTVGQVTYLLLFRFLYYHQEQDLATLEGTLGDVGIGTLGAHKIITVRATEPVRQAIRLMHEHEISGCVCVCVCVCCLCVCCLCVSVRVAYVYMHTYVLCAFVCI